MNNEIVKKSNDLIMNSQYHLSVTEQKLLILLASKVKSDDKEFTEYSFKISDYMNVFDVKNRSLYRDIPSLAKGLMKKLITVNTKEKGEECSAFLSYYSYKNGILTLRFDPFLKPFLLQLCQYYTQYELKYITYLNDKYSIRLYEIMKCNLYKSNFEISLHKLKHILDIQDKYPKYANLKKSVILKSQEELLKTDVSFTFEEIKEGKRVVALKFKIKENKKMNIKKEYEDLMTLEGYFLDKITIDQLKHFYEMSDYDVERVIKVCNYALKQTNLRNFDAFVVSELQNRILFE
jgi:plasmid replication initiation protein